MPNPLRAIVAATDFSFAAHRAAVRAATLAKEHAAALQLLHVVDEASTRSLLRSSSSTEVQQRLQSEAQRSIASLSEDVKKATGIESTQVLREGRVNDEILAAGERSDLIVLGPRGLNPIRDFFLGSTAERLARMLSCAMLVAKQEAQIPYEHVMVPVDFSKYSVAALQFARRLAPDATLHVFHAFDDSVVGTLRSAGVSADAIANFHQSLMRDVQASLAELTVGVPARVLSIAEPGDARVLINQRANELGCTLIVMGKQGRSWIAEHLIGSVTRQVLERATCDVMVVPDA